MGRFADRVRTHVGFAGNTIREATAPARVQVPLGRPRLTQELRDVVVRIGSENLLWGYKRIVGELKKLGLHAGANSVRRILDDAGIHPSPERRRKQPALPWTTFVRAHLESMVRRGWVWHPTFSSP